jgi:hypothetical protein
LLLDLALGFSVTCMAHVLGIFLRVTFFIL